MPRLLSFARALTPAVVVGGMCAAAAGTAIAAAPARIASPCSPDGACLPRYETWGFYETRWRHFPGDVVGVAPTQAETAEETQADRLGGPQLPKASEEGQIGPQRNLLEGGALPEGAAPDAGGAVPPAEGAALPGAEEQPDALPDPLEPFGAAPPAPPSWMVENAAFTRLPGARAAAQAIDEAEAAAPPLATPNLESDDAPPTLPAGLQKLFGGVVPRRRPAGASPAIALVQPSSIARPPQTWPDRHVTPATAETPLGIQLINPAGALMSEPSEDGLQQAIYFEATDATGGATTLQPIIRAE